MLRDFAEGYNYVGVKTQRIGYVYQCASRHLGKIGRKRWVQHPKPVGVIGDETICTATKLR